MEVGIVLRVETGVLGVRSSVVQLLTLSLLLGNVMLYRKHLTLFVFIVRKQGHKISECFALKKSKPVKPVSLAVSSPLRPGCSLLAEVFHSLDTQGSDGDVS